MFIRGGVARIGGAREESAGHLSLCALVLAPLITRHPQEKKIWKVIKCPLLLSLIHI